MTWIVPNSTRALRALAVLALGVAATAQLPWPALDPEAGPELAKSDDGAYWVRGTENAGLLAGLAGAVHVVRPVGGLERVLLPDATSTWTLEPRVGGPATVAISNPDASGHVVYVEFDAALPSQRWMRVRSGAAPTIVHAARGERSVGRHLALDPTGERIAYVARPAVAETLAFQTLSEGTIEIRAVRGGEVVATGERALDDVIAWTPDGARLVIARLEDRESALREAGHAFATDREYADGYRDRARLPVVGFLDPATRTFEPVCIGERPLLAPDGATLLVQDPQMRVRRVDVATRTWEEVALIGLVHPGPFAFVAPDVVLYPAWPTVGDDVRWPEDAPVATLPQERTLKLARIGTDEFVTIARDVGACADVVVGAR